METDAQKIVDYLTSIPAWYLATAENNQPHVRHKNIVYLNTFHNVRQRNIVYQPPV